MGRRRLVLDLSCRRRGDTYFVVTDRWQRFSELAVDEAALAALADSCDEFLVSCSHPLMPESHSQRLRQTMRSRTDVWLSRPRVATYGDAVPNILYRCVTATTCERDPMLCNKHWRDCHHEHASST